jgi:hypothetical protein
MQEVALTRPNAKAALGALRSMLRARNGRGSKRLGDLAQVAYTQDVSLVAPPQVAAHLHNGGPHAPTSTGPVYGQPSLFEPASTPVDQPYFSQEAFIPSLRHSVLQEQEHNPYPDFSNCSMPSAADASYPPGQVVRPHQLWHSLYEQQTLQALDGTPSYSLPSGELQDHTSYLNNDASTYAAMLPDPSHFAYGYRGPPTY